MMSAPAPTSASDPSPAASEGDLRLGLAAGGDLRWAVADVGGPVEEARRRLDLSPLAAVALGRAMAAAALLLRFYSKTPGRLRFEVRGDGPLGRVTAEVDDRGNLRGLVGAPRLPTPDSGELRLAPAIGQGTLRVTRERPGRPPYDSRVALVSGEIGKDLVHFLDQSDQIRSAALVGVLPRPDGVAAAGGLLVEALPGAREESIAGLERNLAALDGVSAHLESGSSPELVAAVLAGFEKVELERYPLRFACGCDRESLRESLLSLGTADLAGITDDAGRCVAECAYCGTTYEFASDELRPH